MKDPTNQKPLEHVPPYTEPRLEIHPATHGSQGVPNFVHVGDNPHALEGYLRLYFRDWNERARNDSTH